MPSNPAIPAHDVPAAASLGRGAGVLALAFGLASLQVALDLQGTSRSLDPGLLRPLFLGALVGVVGGGLLALVLAAGLRSLGGSLGPGEAWTVLARSLRPALAYGGLGVLFNLLLGWNTGLACGLVGLLWAGPVLTAELRRRWAGSLVRAAAIAVPLTLLWIWAWTRFGWF